MTKKLALLAALSAFAFGVPLGAQANQITFGPSTSGGITFTGLGTSVSVTIANPTSGPAFFVGDGGATSPLGSFTLGATTPSPFIAGPFSAERYPIVGVTEPFSFAAGTDLLQGTIAYSFIQDNTTNPQFFGTLTVNSVFGTPDFVSTFPLGATNIAIDFTTTQLPGGQTLDQLVAGFGTATVGISSGELVPGPIVGAGLPGLVAACGGLLALVRRRRRQVA